MPIRGEGARLEISRPADRAAGSTNDSVIRVAGNPAR